MSLEQALAENTAVLTEVAQLLRISNADRAALLQTSGVSSGATTNGAATTADTPLDVAEIKKLAKSADLDTLNAMLATEQKGKARATAIKAIQEAIDGHSTVGDTKRETATTATTAVDKNALPVPAEVSADQTASAIGSWFDETDDEDERVKRHEFITQIVEKLGSRISELELQGRRKAIFYLRRKRAGLDIDFAHAYDFEGSPTQEVKKAAAASCDDLL